MREIVPVRCYRANISVPGRCRRESTSFLPLTASPFQQRDEPSEVPLHTAFKLYHLNGVIADKSKPAPSFSIQLPGFVLATTRGAICGASDSKLQVDILLFGVITCFCVIMVTIVLVKRVIVYSALPDTANCAPVRSSSSRSFTVSVTGILH